MINLKEIKKILVVRLGKIGDIIISSSAVEVLKKNYPNLNISLLTLPKNRDVLKYNPNIDKLYFTNKNLLLYFKVLKLRKNNFDLLIDLNDDPSTTSYLIRKLIKPKLSVGFEYKNQPKPDISISRPPKNKTHIIDRIESLISLLGDDFEKVKFQPKLYLGEIEKGEVFNDVKNLKDEFKIITLNISAGAAIRYWTEQKWIQLIKSLQKDKYKIKLLILSSEKDKPIKNNIINRVDNKFLIPQKYYSFQHYASYICYSDLIITPDTSAVHIASSFDVPVIALYPNYEWNFVSWQPLSKLHYSLKSETERIADISVEKVYNSFEKLYDKI